MSKDHWNSRYSSGEYIYGTKPNEFVKQFLEGREPGYILFPAEGEGRNSVYAASLGWEVDAFDQSEAGRAKAMRLAAIKNTGINYSLDSLEEWQPGGKLYDCIALVFVHLEPGVRVKIHRKMVSALKPGGILILEAFTKKQLTRNSGGPKDPELLFDADGLKPDFTGMEILEINEIEVLLDEGTLHQGPAEVVRLLARKLP